jgi:hypothetical protein
MASRNDLRERFAPWLIVAACAPWGCDGPSVRVDQDESPDAVLGDAQTGGGARGDAAAGGGDASSSAAGVDGDGALGGAPGPDDAAPSTGGTNGADAARPDDDAATPDDDAARPDDDAARPNDDAARPDDDAARPDDDAARPGADAGELDAAPPEPAEFLEGEARAADERVEVEVCANAVCTRTVGGRYRVGPLPPSDRLRWTFSAPAHWTETDETPVDQAPEPVLLFRGVRIAGPEATPARAFFHFDDTRLFLAGGDWLDTVDLAVPLGAPPSRLVGDHFEVYLGTDPDETGVIVRRNVRPGLAGDISFFPYGGAAPRLLFEEAQPWVRFVGPQVLAMTRTREAYSRLVSRTFDADAPEPTPLGDAVPWLLVTTLADGRIAWVAGRAEDARVFVGDADGSNAVALESGPVASTFLGNTTGSRGLLWLSPERTLWRARTPETPPDALVDEVLTSPRPLYRPDGALIVFTGEPASATALRLDPIEPGSETYGPPRRLVAGADASTFSPAAEGFYIVRPREGMAYAPWNAEGPGTGVRGERFELVTHGRGAIALVNTASTKHTPGSEFRFTGVSNLSQLQTAPGGATAWQADTRSLWYFPGPEIDLPPRLLAVGAAAPGRVVDSLASRIYAQDADGWRAIDLPEGNDVPFDQPVQRVVPVDADRVLGTRAAPDGALRSFDPRTGESHGWAEGVTLVERSPRRNFVFYACARGLFLVPLSEP